VTGSLESTLVHYLNSNSCFMSTQLGNIEDSVTKISKSLQQKIEGIYAVFMYFFVFYFPSFCIN
jgi:hypothetical protein